MAYINPSSINRLAPCVTRTARPRTVYVSEPRTSVTAYLETTLRLIPSCIMACPWPANSIHEPDQHLICEGEHEIPIPQPPSTLLLGHFPLMNPTFPVKPIQQLAELYGGIYSLQLGRRLVIVSSQELVNELCDQDRFCKDINLALNELRALTKDGLFTVSVL